VLSLPTEKQDHPHTSELRSGVHPVDFKRDLAALADLIELAFADSMDSSGRAAIREMRMLSKMGAGARLFSGLNDFLSGITPGYVWFEDGRLVGNVSVYPANLPREFPPTWIIANVATHPAYRGRGIARRLMLTALDAIAGHGRRYARASGGRAAAILQVERDNHPARRLYEALGFVEEGTFTHWRRPPLARSPQPLENPPHISHPRRGEWREEYALAVRARPPLEPGRPPLISWLRPLHPDLFQPSLRRWLDDLVNLRSRERLLIRSRDELTIEAELWIESAVASDSVSLTLLSSPDYRGLYDEALLNTAVRRFGVRAALAIDHPADDEVAAALLRRYSFNPVRTLVVMRWTSGPS
jgi:GNAT superfamily N-acetyltransferase